MVGMVDRVLPWTTTTAKEEGADSNEENEGKDGRAIPRLPGSSVDVDRVENGEATLGFQLLNLRLELFSVSDIVDDNGRVGHGCSLRSLVSQRCNGPILAWENSYVLHLSRLDVVLQEGVSVDVRSIPGSTIGVPVTRVTVLGTVIVVVCPGRSSCDSDDSEDSTTAACSSPLLLLVPVSIAVVPRVSSRFWIGLAAPNGTFAEVPDRSYE